MYLKLTIKDSSVLNGNGTGAATVIDADYELWKEHFGKTRDDIAKANL